ncbi:hypothetical protein, partial [Ruegeria sp. HKCCA6707]|uniref:hypothetical protein n=1 Tax=Ruegeria sp. HKCCA6707 TaxID=2682996 RepID=UPI001C2B8E40
MLNLKEIRRVCVAILLRQMKLVRFDKLEQVESSILGSKNRLFRPTTSADSSKPKAVNWQNSI